MSKITKITASPTSIPSLYVGSSTQISTTITPANAQNKVLAYSSSNTNVASVSSSGLVTGISVGSAIVTISSTDGSNTTTTVSVTVLPIYVSSITASSITSLPIGSTQQISPAILPANATNKAVTYSSSNTNIATVSSSGLVTGVSIGGPVTITISAADGSGVKGYIQVTIVPVKVTSITSSPSSISNLTVGAQQQLTPTVLPANATNKGVVYSSSDINIVSVDANGLVTGISIGGPVNITISSTDGSAVTTTVPVTVVPIQVTSIVANPISIPSLTVGDGQQITYTVFPENATNQTVTYSSSNTNIATVDSDGIVTGVDVGSVTITLTATDGSNVTTSVPVTISPIYVNSIMADPTSLSVDVGDTVQVTFTVLPENATNQTVTYSSSDTDIATIDSDGIVTGVADGFANITISSTDSSDVYTTIPITVNAVKVSSISTSPISINLNVGSVQRITSTVLPTNATNPLLRYSSSKTSIATVTSTGLVKGISIGGPVNIIIAARDGSGISTTVPVTVTAIKVSSITSIPNSVSSLRIGNSQQLTPTVLPANAANKSLIYSSSDTDIATVSSSGLVTGVSVGSVDITISAADGSGISTVVPVTIVPVYVTGILAMPGGMPYFHVGDTQQLTPTVLPANATNKDLTYTSSNTDIVTVDSDGLVTGIGLGSANITIAATDGSNIIKTIAVKIIPIKVTSITSSPDTISNMIIGGTQQLTPTVLPDNATDKGVTYVSSNPKIATVSSSGLVTGVAIGGPVNIIIIAADGSRISTVVRVIVVPVKVSSITSSPVSISNLTVGGTQQLTPTVLPANATNKAVSYSSSNTNIVKVDSNGLVTGVAIGGPVNITISSRDGSNVSRNVSVTVTAIKVSSITSTPNSVSSLRIGGTQQLTPTVLPANATNKAVSYSSSNTNIVKVNSTGLITGVSAGTTTITIAAMDGSDVTRTVSVTVIPVLVNNITASSIAALTVGTTQKITPTILPANATNKAVTYTSSDTSKVTVTSTGIVTGIATGIANITIAAMDGSNVSRTVSVTVVRK